MANKFQLFLNKENKKANISLGLNPSEKAKPTYISQLFSKSLWLPRLKNVRLEASSEASAKVEVNEPVVVAPQNTAKAEKSTSNEPIILKEANEAKEVQAPKVETSTPAPTFSIKSSLDKSEEDSSSPVNKEYLVNEDFNSYLQSINPDWSLDQVPGIQAFSGSVDVLFYGLNEFSKDELPEIAPISLIESQQDLLGKMIAAMKLKEGSFVRYPLLKDGDDIDFLVAGIHKFKPKVVVPLGASSTNHILQKRVKLSNVHGEMTKKSLNINGESLLVNVSPLFHPQLLEINQSMKRTAWLDMQKVMTFLSQEV